MGIDEVERLGHGDEYFFFDSGGDILLFQPVGKGVFVHFFDVFLALKYRRNQTDAETDFFGPSEHIVVSEDSHKAIQRSRNVGKIKPRIGSGSFWLIENHGMFFPLQPIFNVKFFEELEHIRICTKEDVEAGFVPVAISIFPGGYFAAEYVPTF